MSATIDHLALLTIVDAVQMPLDHVSGSDWSGLKARSLQLGPFHVSYDARLITDQCTAKKASAFVKIRKDLWLYFVSTESGRELQCHVLNGNLCGLSLSTIDFVKRGDADKTLAAVEKGVVGKYKYNSDGWTRI